MTILITGSAGFIGCNFVNWLLANTDHKIIGIDNLSGGFMENVQSHDRNIFYPIDVNSDELHYVFETHKPQIVYHFAAYASEGRSNYINAFIHQNNTVGTANIINHCVNNKAKLVFISSIAVYSGTPPFTEDMTPNPIDCYGVSKYTSEMNVRIAGLRNGLDYVILRPYNVYGEYQNIWDESRNVCGIFMHQYLSGKPLTVFGDGSQSRSFTYVGDLMKPMYLAGTIEWLKANVINIGSKSPCTINRLVQFLRDITEGLEVEHIEERHEIKCAFCDNSKAVQMLEYKDEVGLIDGLSMMLGWAKTQRKRELMKPPALEIFETNHPSIK